MALDISKLKFPNLNLAPVTRTGPVNTLQGGYNTVTKAPQTYYPSTLGASTSNPYGMAGGDLPPGPPAGYYDRAAAYRASGGQGDVPVGWNGAGAAPDLAFQRYRSAIDQANKIRTSGRATIEDLLKSVAGFRDRAKTQFANAGQQITNTASELLGSAANTAYELAGQGRAQGRALQLGDSSKFNRQQKVNAGLAATQGATLANRGENERANQGQLDERYGQADQQEGSINTYRRGIEDQASAVEAAGVDNYGSALNSLIQYQQQLAGLNPMNAGGLQQYAPNTNGLQNALGAVLSSQAARPIAGGDMGGNLANPTDIATLLRQRQGLYQG